MVAMKLGMFGRGAMPYGTPPIAPTPEEQAPYGQAGGAITAEAPRPGFFDHNGLGVSLLGNISDGILALNGMQGGFGQMQQQQRQFRQQQQQYQQHRQDENSDWQARQMWEIAHPKPVNNDTVNDYDFISKTLGPEAGRQYLQTIAAGPPMAVDAIDPVTRDTVRQYVPRGQLPGMAPQAVPAQGLPQGFTVRKRGGAAPQGAGTFR